MFEPNPPVEFKESIAKRKPPKIEGVAAILAKEKDIFEKGPPPPKEEYETPRQRHARLAAAKKKVLFGRICHFAVMWLVGISIVSVLAVV